MTSACQNFQIQNEEEDGRKKVGVSGPTWGVFECARAQRCAEFLTVVVVVAVVLDKMSCTPGDCLWKFGISPLQKWIRLKCANKRAYFFHPRHAPHPSPPQLKNAFSRPGLCLIYEGWLYVVWLGHQRDAFSTHGAEIQKCRCGPGLL